MVRTVPGSLSEAVLVGQRVLQTETGELAGMLLGKLDAVDTELAGVQGSQAERETLGNSLVDRNGAGAV